MKVEKTQIVKDCYMWHISSSSKFYYQVKFSLFLLINFFYRIDSSFYLHENACNINLKRINYQINRAMNYYLVI
ncbi:hypothetical protein BpHYR1_052029 [Brachionus plicatilis]|uniref:Uncharacterized protein n=1 Tax=Brachionus plicatilis TaxID=10195 RepID=A0A3M7PZ07_BRAPC|nr:hypothetical protein BpHYR1_052029 [Brachionus plicatilis]